MLIFECCSLFDLILPLSFTDVDPKRPSLFQANNNSHSFLRWHIQGERRV